MTLKLIFNITLTLIIIYIFFIYNLENLIENVENVENSTGEQTSATNTQFTDQQKIDIKKIINELYMSDVDAIRNLSDVATKLQTPSGLIIPGAIKGGAITGTSLDINQTIKLNYTTVPLTLYDNSLSYIGSMRIFKPTSNVNISSGVPTDLCSTTGVTIPMGIYIINYAVHFLLSDNMTFTKISTGLTTKSNDLGFSFILEGSKYLNGIIYEYGNHYKTNGSDCIMINSAITIYLTTLHSYTGGALSVNEHSTTLKLTRIG